MTLSTKGARKITVGSEEFYWRIRRRPTYERGLGANLTLAIQLNGEGNSVLVVTCNGPRPDSWIKEEKEVVVTPRHIEDIIVKATNSGWKHKNKGGSFEFGYEIT